MAKFTLNLVAASPAERPAVLMGRAHGALTAALKIRSEHGGPLGTISWPPEHQRFIAYCELALRDFGEILVVYAQSPEAPEATYSVGQVNDYPNLSQFDTALGAYRLTVERYPGTSWAQKAGERIRAIEGLFDAGKGNPHTERATKPEPEY